MQAGKRGNQQAIRPGCRLCVTGLPPQVKKTVLQGAFDDFGRIVSIEMPADQKSTAFIEFEDPRDAGDARGEMDGSMLERHRISVTVGDRRPKFYTNGNPVGESSKADYLQRSLTGGSAGGSAGGGDRGSASGGRERSRSRERRRGRSRSRSRRR
mmetsp:Transcript_12758/g.34514  ORF Transcript_12758/g.34514 Transcript_12758/m.34514 type:complete len:155 (-) Transcript_12758:59-523(-)